MPTRTARAAAKRRNPSSARRPPNATERNKIAALPEWDLSDLYAGLDSPEIKDDLARADALCLSFEEQYRGKLAALASGPDGGKALAEAVRTMESIDDLIGRVASYAQLLYS